MLSCVCVCPVSVTCIQGEEQRCGALSRSDGVAARTVVKRPTPDLAIGHRGHLAGASPTVPPFIL
ncbi:hypothetical protein UPYG_G00025850 [Umbra pygmaea]|uniref:Secreted protein n=1 Tax=Umbra pygmaea TaxID=75934 RepID=A0ABD0XLV7_UMBPY